MAAGVEAASRRLTHVADAVRVTAVSVAALCSTMSSHPSSAAVAWARAAASAWFQVVCVLVSRPCTNDVPGSLHQAGDHHGASYDDVFSAVSSGSSTVVLTPSAAISDQCCSSRVACASKSLCRPEPTAASVTPETATISARLARASGDVRMSVADGSGVGP